jgi:hypothetical protein
MVANKTCWTLTSLSLRISKEALTFLGSLAFEGSK